MRNSFFGLLILFFVNNSTGFSQTITFELKEKRTRYLKNEGSDANICDKTETAYSTLIFDLKDSLVSIKDNNGISTTKLSSLSKNGDQYFFQTTGELAIDDSKKITVYYMIDLKKQIGRQKYLSFCMKDMWHVVDFKGQVKIKNLKS
ncbi:MAG: hypothetical protein FJZ67_04460 [Bacteroidetes bacterium]|nr:hypothetical protein [Bacteroidota bacterium]